MKKDESIHELVLNITNDMNYVPEMNQELFDKVIDDALRSEYSLENVWRIAFNYDSIGLNYDMIDNIFIEAGDAYYLSEYISAVHQVNYDKIVKMLIEKNDKEFIKDFLFKYTDFSGLDRKYVDKLREFVNK